MITFKINEVKPWIFSEKKNNVPKFKFWIQQKSSN
jgi:hypothetical protein